MFDLLNEYHNMLTKNLGSTQKCSDAHFILLLADLRKLFKIFRAKSCIPSIIISDDSKKWKQVVALK